MWISASDWMWVLGWNTRRLLWSWRRRPRVIKATTNTPLLYISWGQCWITKTCHHETPALDWFLLPSAVRSNFEIPKPPAINFFCTFCWMRKLWGGSDQKSSLLSFPQKMMQWTPRWVLYSRAKTPPGLFISFIWQVEQQWQKHNKTLNTWIRENLTQWQETRKTGGFFL